MYKFTNNISNFIEIFESKIVGDMQGRIVIYFALAFVLGAAVCGFITFYTTSPLIAPIFFLAISLSLIPALLYFTHSKTICTLIFIAFLCGILSGLSGGIDRNNFGFISKATTLKGKFSNKIEELFPQSKKESAVLKAIIIGDKSALDKSLRNDYKASGAMHLLALSGMHIGIVYAFISMLLSFLGNSPLSKHTKRLIILLFLWGYAFITGLSSSISRAVIMITIYEMTAIMQSEKHLLRALAISAFITTLFKPTAPLEIGFQLSYSAVVAIYFIFPKLKGIMVSRSKLLTAIWTTLALSISCQIATAPLTYLYFGTFPRYFLVTNLLAIPLTGVIMYTIPFALLLKPIRPAVYFLTSLLNDIIHIIANI